jgi:antitoxin (DNA-binding transcriptional repressor) of toxin-antitoxin stability system
VTAGRSRQEVKSIVIIISKSKLKAQMWSIFREIEETGEEVIVTDNSRPVLRIRRIQAKRPVEEVFADVRGKVVYLEDINLPTVDEVGP